MSGPRKRGQPLVVLAALLMGWVGARVSTIGGAEASSLPTVSRMVATSPSANIAAARVDPGAAPEHIGLQSYPTVADSAFYPQPAYGAGYPTVVYYLPAPGGYPSVRPSPALRYTTQTDRLAGLPQEQRDRAADTSGMYLAADYPGQPIGRMALEDGGALPLGFTGAPQARPGLQVPQYGEPNALLGSKIGRLIGDKRRWSMDAWTLLRKSGGRVHASIDQRRLSPIKRPIFEPSNALGSPYCGTCKPGLACGAPVKPSGSVPPSSSAILPIGWPG